MQAGSAFSPAGGGGNLNTPARDRAHQGDRPLHRPAPLHADSGAVERGVRLIRQVNPPCRDPFRSRLPWNLCRLHGILKGLPSLVLSSSEPLRQKRISPRSLPQAPPGSEQATGTLSLLAKSRRAAQSLTQILSCHKIPMLQSDTSNLGTETKERALHGTARVWLERKLGR